MVSRGQVAFLGGQVAWLVGSGLLLFGVAEWTPERTFSVWLSGLFVIHGLTAGTDSQNWRRNVLYLGAIGYVIFSVLVALRLGEII